MRPRDDLSLVLRLLEKSYGKRPWRTWGDPVSVLVATILSQNTSDTNSSAGYRQLRRRFRTWDAVAAAPVEEIEKCIRICGLSRMKAPRIRAILRAIRLRGTGVPPVESPARPKKDRRAVRPTDTKRISLDFLRRATPQAATEYLRSFPGVGPKTAACVLLFSLRMPVFPVDTHIERIAKRLGLVPARATAEEVQEDLTPRIPPRRRYAMHVLLIEHGRRTCRARRPRCPWCPLLAFCPHGRKRQSAPAARRSPQARARG